MIRRIAFIHTVAMLVERFRPRFQSELPDADCFHMLDESVLQDLIRQGPSSGITRRIVTLSQMAADAGAELIVFTCSSTSPAIDVARQTVAVPILKIDDPLYARDIAVQSVLCAAAFDALASGRRELHDRLVGEAAAELAPRVDRIVLAQASLAHLAAPLAEQLGLPVFARPELLVQEVLARVRDSA
jgi:Asp/Glu/hydantoin racemase